MRDMRDAFLLLFLSNLALLASAGFITATFYTTIFVDIALTVTALTFALASMALFILSLLSARIGFNDLKNGRAA